MSYILRLDCSPRQSDSHSRYIADSIEKQLLKLQPQLQIKNRDLSLGDIPVISEQTISGFYATASAMTAELIDATALSDELISEINNATFIIIATPMYNFSVPAALKAWIDQIVRINRTFAYDGTQFTGLVPVKQAYLALAYGAAGYAPGGDFATMNFLEPYLQSLLTFLGIENTHTFRLEGTTGDAANIASAKQSLQTRIAQAVV
ncbi:NAD(P)H-dependent oxidoreductase [Alteromonadaceae bacterium BrNp21-10]|nr:NAD(P)H-dependent oxidoreductase [Alteromonadaceae bacterium BrNp21-10]